MMKVGSMRGAWAVGGMKGVAVGAGEQADAMKRVNEKANRIILSKGEERLAMIRSISLNKKSDC